MNFSKRNKSIVDILFILALFGSFAITGLFVVLFGARVYQGTVARMDANYASRTALSYVTEKIRSHDYRGSQIGGIEIVHNGDGDALVMKETVNDRVFVTYLYKKEGKLVEFTADEQYDFHYDAGTPVLTVEKFAIDRIGEALYHFDIVDEFGNNTQFYVTVYSDSDGGANE